MASAIGLIIQVQCRPRLWSAIMTTTVLIIVVSNQETMNRSNCLVPSDGVEFFENVHRPLSQ